MTTNNYIELKDSAFFEINGIDKNTFLQGLITNDINKSHEIMKKTFDLNPNHPNAIFNYGFSLAQFKKFDEALQLINKALLLDLNTFAR